MVEHIAEVHLCASREKWVIAPQQDLKDRPQRVELARSARRGSLERAEQISALSSSDPGEHDEFRLFDLLLKFGQERGEGIDDGVHHRVDEEADPLAQSRPAAASGAPLASSKSGDTTPVDGDPRNSG